MPDGVNTPYLAPGFSAKKSLTLEWNVSKCLRNGKTACAPFRAKAQQMKGTFK